MAEQTTGIDVRFFCGIPDVSELPGAYKNAATVRRQIEQYGLAEIVDQIDAARLHHGRRLAAQRPLASRTARGGADGRRGIAAIGTGGYH